MYNEISFSSVTRCLSITVLRVSGLGDGERGQRGGTQPVAELQKLHTEANSGRRPPPSKCSLVDLIESRWAPDWGILPASHTTFSQLKHGFFFFPCWDQIKKKERRCYYVLLFVAIPFCTFRLQWRRRLILRGRAERTTRSRDEPAQLGHVGGYGRCSNMTYASRSRRLRVQKTNCRQISDWEKSRLV